MRETPQLKNKQNKQRKQHEEPKKTHNSKAKHGRASEASN